MSTDEEPAGIRRALAQCRAQLRRAEEERNDLRADLSRALDQAEHWRTLAEYRERRLLEQDGGDVERIRRLATDLGNSWPSRKGNG